MSDAPPIVSPDAPPGVAVILAKAPEPGRVKTRLAPALGADGAAQLHRAMARDVEANCVTAGLRCGWSIAGDLAHPWVKGLRARGHTVAPQPGGDLGARIDGALALALADAPPGAAALALGVDSPTLPPAYLARAAQTAADVVLGPAFDGGYWLIGWRRAPPGLLDGVPWSTHETLAETVLRCRSAGLSVELLPYWYDVDEPRDLSHLRQHLRVLPPQTAPHTRAALAALEEPPCL